MIKCRRELKNEKMQDGRRSSTAAAMLLAALLVSIFAYDKSFCRLQARRGFPPVKLELPTDVSIHPEHVLLFERKIPPIYPTEVFLGALAVLYAALCIKSRRLLLPANRTFTILLGIYMFMGVMGLARGFPGTRVEALRDSVIWYYGLFAFFAAALVSPEHARKIMFACFVAAAFALVRRVANNIQPQLPAALSWLGHPGPIPAASDVYLAFGAAYAIAMLNLNPWLRGAIAGLFVGQIIYGQVRGSWVGLAGASLLAAAGAVGPLGRRPVLLLSKSAAGAVGPLGRRPVLLLSKSAARALIGAAAGAAIFISVLWTVKPEGFAPVGMLRTMLPSAKTTVAAAAPAGGTAESARATELQQAKASTVNSKQANTTWRLKVWRELIETTMRENPVFGVGMGFPMQIMSAKRSVIGFAASYNWFNIDPHNSHLAILYRMGLTGLLAHLALSAFIIFFAMKSLSGGAAGQQDSAPAVLMFAFIFSWLNAGFCVSLEGPYMGVVYWSLMGLLLSTAGTGGSSPGETREPAETLNRP